jgi:P27 family predicted phage terminase small subunit
MTVRKPTEQKKLEGTYRADRAARNEPKPEVMIPACPSWLTGEARKEYNRHAKMLVNLRVLTEADRLALAALIHEFSAWREAETMVGVLGAVLISEKTGAPYLNPWQNIASNHFKNMVKLMGEFGLTPASRSRIEAQPEEEKQTSLAEKLFAGVSLE